MLVVGESGASEVIVRLPDLAAAVPVERSMTALPEAPGARACGAGVENPAGVVKLRFNESAGALAALVSDRLRLAAAPTITLPNAIGEASTPSLAASRRSTRTGRWSLVPIRA